VTSAAVVSVGGAPGVTTLVCATALASQDRPLLVIEAAPSGGVIAARWRLDVSDTVITTARLAMETASGAELWAAAHHPWLAASRVVPAHPSPVVMHQAQVRQWLAGRLPHLQRPVLVDAGRVDGSADQFDLLSAVDVVWVLLDPIVEQVVAARAVAEWLTRTGPVRLLVREPAGDPARDSAASVAAALGWSVASTVPSDPHSARALCGHATARRNLLRAPLLRTGRALAYSLAPMGVHA
jgi:predicted nicotinamide N-methyase